MSILAADLGGTRTRVVVADGGGRFLARAEAGSGNPVRVGTTAATESLRHAADVALDTAGRPAISVAAVGMAGISHSSAATVVAAALDAVGVRPGIRVLVDDASIAFRAAFTGPPGVLVMAGTGSGVRAWGETGPTTFGGFGPIFGDEGSAYDIGRRAVRLCLDAAQSKEPASALATAILERAGATDVRRLPELARNGRLDLADLCPVVVRAAEAGDHDATTALWLAASVLHAQAVMAARQVGAPKGTGVATTGSVFACAMLRDRLMETITKSGFLVPGPHVDDPVLGAVGLAKDALAAGGTVPPGW
jgi:N-acetylglucosamine kinase-like BadF-type ATPase